MAKVRGVGCGRVGEAYDAEVCKEVYESIVAVANKELKDAATANDITRIIDQETWDLCHKHKMSMNYVCWHYPDSSYKASHAFKPSISGLNCDLKVELLIKDCEDENWVMECYLTKT